MTVAPSAGTVLAVISALQDQLVLLAREYVSAEEWAYSGQGGAGEKVKLSGADPAGELAVATVDEEGRETEMAEIRKKVATAARHIVHMGLDASKARGALHAAMRPSQVVITAEDTRAPAARKIGRHTADELEAMERRATARVIAEGRQVRAAVRWRGANG